MALKSILLIVCVIATIAIQEISCAVVVGKQKRIDSGKLRLRKRQNTAAVAAAPYTYAAAPVGGGAALPALPPLPDTSNVFSSLNVVTGLTQQIPNLTGGQRPAAQAYSAPAAAPAAPAASSGGGKDEKHGDDEADEDENND